MMPASHDLRAPEMLNRAKLVLAGIGVLVWAHGARIEDAGVRWAGIALLAIAFLLRFLRRREGAS